MSATEITQYGFNYGPMIVERLAHDDKLGWVLLIRSEDREHELEIRVTPKGRKWTVRAKDSLGCVPVVWEKP
jgi:hypothetical protein